jgi:putative nucleotidyltransferase with HDIG domain
MRTETTLQRIRRWLVAPSLQVTGPDRRRQASLLSSLLLGIIFVAIVVELATVLLIRWEGYTGYRQTIAAVIMMAVIYAISRTRYVRLAAVLAVIVASLAIFFTGWAVPGSVLGGLLDFLILPLWLASLYLTPLELGVLIGANLAGLLLFPTFTPEITLNDILIGPFSFIFATSVLLVIITRHRDRLEQDRRAELAEQEGQSRRAADRAGALLRVAGRLNAQLDLDRLLQAVSEEVSLALEVPVAVITLYDPKRDALFSVTGTGIPTDSLNSLPPLPRALYDQTVQQSGDVFSIEDLQHAGNEEFTGPFKKLDIRSLAFAAMTYERELIGSLVAITRGEQRRFTKEDLLLLEGLADQAALAITNTRVYKDARRRLEHLQALRAIDLAISSNHDLQETLDVVLKQITGQLDVDAAVILLLDGTKQTLEFGNSRGFNTSMLRYTSLRIGEGMAGRAALERQIVSVRDLRSDPHTLFNAPELAKEGLVSYYAAPLIAQGQVRGVLEIFHRSLLDPDVEWLSFLEILAGQAAIAIESTSLFEDLKRTNEELSNAYNATIEGWSLALDLRDKETEGHTRRVTELTLELAQSFGFSERELVYIRWGALLHDIGKMGVPDRILLKEGPLSPEEWVIMRQHPVYAHEMLRTIQYLQLALDIPYAHHEKWDGSGYPRGLKGEEIPLAARIFAVVDVWDALTSDRPYRAAWSREKTLSHIQAGEGAHFDPQVVHRFMDLIHQKMDGTKSEPG